MNFCIQPRFQFINFCLQSMLPKSPRSALWCQWVNGLISMSCLIYLSTSPWIELLRFSQYLIAAWRIINFQAKLSKLGLSLSRLFLSGVKIDMPLSVNLPFLATFILCCVRIYAKEAEVMISRMPSLKRLTLDACYRDQISIKHIWPFKPTCQLNLTNLLWSCWYSLTFVLCSLWK